MASFCYSHRVAVVLEAMERVRNRKGREGKKEKAIFLTFIARVLIFVQFALV